MIVLDIALHSARDFSIQPRGRIVIDNQGVNGKLRDYRIRAYDRNAAQLPADEMLRQAQPFREGTVTGHNSDAESIWVLAMKGLAAMGYKLPDSRQPDLFKD